MTLQNQTRNEWFQRPPGSFIASQELYELKKLLPIMPNGIAIQIGGPPDFRSVCGTKKNRLYYCTNEIHTDFASNMICCFDQLPFESSSVSLVIMAHAFEFFSNPQLLLQEAYRVLKPGGQLVIVGFNYWSWLSVRQAIKKRHEYPGKGAFYSVWTVARWLLQEGYTVIDYKTFYFSKPNQFIEIMGLIVAPTMGAVYLMYAQKKATGTTLIGNLNPLKQIHRSVAVVRSTSRV